MDASNAPERWPEVIVITGPTASGKSALAIEVADRLGAEIISADSRQVYRHIPVTTAVPTPEERLRVKHHLVECKELDEYYSAALWADDAMNIIERCARRGCRYAVVCGGSTMYIDALLYGLDDLPTISESVRQRVKDLYSESGNEGVVALLSNLDPEYADRVDRANTRRVMHAVEICLQTGRKASELLTGTQRRAPFPFFKFALGLSRQDMFERINRRVDMMVAAGMEAEARSVFPLRHLNSLNTIGFKEWFAHFDGLMTRDTAIARIAKNTRVFAKKQMTRLTADPDITWLNPDTAFDDIIRLVTGAKTD